MKASDFIGLVSSFLFFSFSIKYCSQEQLVLREAASVVMAAFKTRDHFTLICAGQQLDLL